MPTIAFGSNIIKARSMNGLTVRQARENSAHLLMIPDDAIATMQGEKVEDGYTLGDRDKLKFVEPDLQMSRGLTAEEFCELFNIAKGELEKLIESGQLQVITMPNGEILILESAADNYFRRRKDEVCLGSVDGPIPPDSFCFNGIVYKGFTALEWHLLKSLRDLEAVEMGAMYEIVYGKNHEHKEDALTSVIKRLNKKLRKKSFPGAVKPRNGWLSLIWNKSANSPS